MAFLSTGGSFPVGVGKRKVPAGASEGSTAAVIGWFRGWRRLACCQTGPRFDERQRQARRRRMPHCRDGERRCAARPRLARRFMPSLRSRSEAKPVVTVGLDCGRGRCGLRDRGFRLALRRSSVLARRLRRTGIAGHRGLPHHHGGHDADDAQRPLGRKGGATASREIGELGG